MNPGCRICNEEIAIDARDELGLQRVMFYERLCRTHANDVIVAQESILVLDLTTLDQIDDGVKVRPKD